MNRLIKEHEEKVRELGSKNEDEDDLNSLAIAEFRQGASV